ncbi:unnamed protein product [Rhodiola kirilowii]
MAESSSAKDFVVPAIPKFDGHYDHWERLMENFIRSKESWDLIEHGIFPLEKDATDSQKKLIEDQKLRDLKLKNFLYQSIDRDVLDTTLNTDTSKQIWDSMKQKYQGSTKVKRAQLQALRREFEILNMKDGETVNNSLARVMTIAKKMKACGGGGYIKEIMIIEKIIRSLSKKFNYAVCAIEESNNLDTITLDELQSSLLLHEQRMVDDNEDDHVLKISCDEKGIGSRGQRPYRGSFRGGRRRGRSYHRAHVECFNCHKLGHSQFDCPNSSKVANYAELDDKEELLLMSYVDKEEVQRDGVWFLDLGCSNHMTGLKHWFTSLIEGFRHSVKLGNSERMEVRGK